MHRPGVELATFRSRVRRSDHYTTEAHVVRRVCTNNENVVISDIIISQRRPNVHRVPKLRGFCLSTMTSLSQLVIKLNSSTSQDIVNWVTTADGVYWA